MQQNFWKCLKYILVISKELPVQDLFKTLSVEYSVQLWHPYLARDIDILEQVDSSLSKN